MKILKNSCCISIFNSWFLSEIRLELSLFHDYFFLTVPWIILRSRFFLLLYLYSLILITAFIVNTTFSISPNDTNSKMSQTKQYSWNFSAIQQDLVSTDTFKQVYFPFSPCLSIRTPSDAAKNTFDEWYRIAKLYVQGHVTKSIWPFYRLYIA